MKLCDARAPPSRANTPGIVEENGDEKTDGENWEGWDSQQLCVSIDNTFNPF